MGGSQLSAVDDAVLVERDGPVALVTLNRPKALNALSKSLVEALLSALDELDRDPQVRCMIVTGSGRAFAAGADINEMKDLDGASAARAALDLYLSRWDRVARLNKPVIAAVSGFVLGGGCELMMACDMAIAAEDALFGQPEISIGVIPGAGGTQRLARAVGKALAMDMTLTGRRLTAAEAQSFGLVSRVLAPEALLPEAKRMARQIADMPPIAAQAAKDCVRLAHELPLADGVKYERDMFYRLFETHDQKEGMRAFAEKRPPRFEGR